MRDSIVTIGEIKKFPGADNIAVLIDPIELYNLLRHNGVLSRDATERVTQHLERRRLHSAINNAIIQRQQMQAGEERSNYLASHRDMHKHYLKSAKIARMFTPRLPK